MEFKKILIVDDSSTARMLIMNYLQIAGMDNIEFFEADDGSNALALLEETSVDLIITDIIMPKMDGNVFIQKLRLKKDFKRIPVIILTSLAENALKLSQSDKRMRVVQKPVTPEKLVEVLEDLL